MEFDMESIFGIETLAKEAATRRMIQVYEQEIRETARLSNLLKQADPNRRAWYCPVLVRAGEALIAFGTRLKIRYSPRSALHTS
jgi:hypothetical protein